MVCPEQDFTWRDLALSLPWLPSPSKHRRLEVVVAKHLEDRQCCGEDYISRNWPGCRAWWTSGAAGWSLSAGTDLPLWGNSAPVRPPWKNLMKIRKKISPWSSPCLQEGVLVLREANVIEPPGQTLSLVMQQDKAWIGNNLNLVVEKQEGKKPGDPLMV